MGEDEGKGQYRTVDELKEKLRWMMTEDHVACRMGVESIFPRMWRSYDASYGDKLDPFPTEEYDADMFSPSKIKPKPKVSSSTSTTSTSSTTASKPGKSKVGRKKRTKDDDNGETNRLASPSAAKTTTPTPVKVEEKKDKGGGLFSWLWGGSEDEKKDENEKAASDAEAAALKEKKLAASARSLSAAESVGSSDEYDRIAGKINPVKRKWKILYKRVEYFMAELGEKRQRVCIPVDFNKDRVWNERHINYF